MAAPKVMVHFQGPSTTTGASTPEATMKNQLNFREFWDLVGTDHMMAICESVGSSRKMFLNLRYGLKFMSRRRADEIIAAALSITGIAPSRAMLIEGVPRAERSQKILPHPDFIKAGKRRQARASAKKVPAALPLSTKPARGTSSAAILVLLAKGLSKPAICARLGVHRATINKVLATAARNPY